MCSELYVYNNVLRATYKGVSQAWDKSGMTAYLITAEAEVSMVNMKRSEIASLSCSTRKRGLTRYIRSHTDGCALF